MPRVDTDYMQKRTTSAGYRFPLSSRPKSSEYHEKCIPAADRARVQAAAQDKGPAGKPIPESALVDEVTNDKIWKQSVHNEKTGEKQWEENWGFLTELDSKGRPKSAKQLPDKVNMFADGSVPNTNAGNYGSRLNTEIGQSMQQLERQFHSNNRKQKLSNEMVCY